MRFLPVFLDLAQGVVGLAGSGAAASSKLRLLRAAGARVRWFADDLGAIEDDLGAEVHSGRIEISSADPLRADFSDLIAVVSATGDGRDADIAAQARRQRIPVNVVDRPDLSTFIFPAIVDRGEVVVAIGTGGAAPVLARRLRERIEALLPARIGDLAALMGRFRAPAARKRRGTDALRRFWERVVDGPIGAAALDGRWHEAETALARASERPDDARGSCGVVFLVGAGPGDPDLLTLRALQALQGADVVLYDDTVSAEILDRARRDAERVFVGRRAGDPGVGQDAINRRLADAARAGRNAVRLKGGDAFSFVRSGGEIDYLRQAGVAAVVVPGVAAPHGRAAAAAVAPASEIAA
jgi:uroporphyrin-III C-methyltransferase / precorrin-2 dehydrogenase / sirohydrochlorin ferrochelatase